MNYVSYSGSDKRARRTAEDRGKWPGWTHMSSQWSLAISSDIAHGDQTRDADEVEGTLSWDSLQRISIDMGTYYMLRELMSQMNKKCAYVSEAKKSCGGLSKSLASIAITNWPHCQLLHMSSWMALGGLEMRATQLQFNVELETRLTRMTFTTYRADLSQDLRWRNWSSINVQWTMSLT